MSIATVLVIEDNRDILDATRLLLEHEGFKVFTAEEGFTGIDCLALYQPDVVVTDIGLPEMTGLEFIRQVRSLANYDNLPIIAMSGYDMAYLAAAVNAGANAALHKPGGLDELTATIHQVFAGSGAERAIQ